MIQKFFIFFSALAITCNLKAQEYLSIFELDRLVKPDFEITTPPVISDFTFHDASVIDGEDGFFYAFASCNTPRDNTKVAQYPSYFSVAIFRSNNLKNWDFYKYAMSEKLRDGKQGRFRIKDENRGFKEYPIWAPDIIKYKGRYLLYCAFRNTYNDSKIALFESRSLSEDFEYKGIVVSADKNDNSAFVTSKETIDPNPIIDNGKLYLVYGSFARWYNGKPLPERRGMGVYIVRLEEDGLKMKGTPVFLTDYYEGVCIVKHKNKYTLFGSIGAWKNDSQRICYATSKNLMGPYKNINGFSIADTTNYNPGDLLIHAKGSNNGFGCMSRPVKYKNKEYVLCNGHSTKLPKINGESNETERYGFIFQLKWKNNKPELVQYK